MQAFILIGAFTTPDGPQVENLYTGLDGEALQDAAAKAATSKKYHTIGKIVNPTVIPMAIVGGETRGSKPSFPRPRDIKPATAPAGPLSKLAKAADDLRNKRNEAAPKVALQGGKLAQPTVPVKSSPTFEEYIAAGYDPATYPPKGSEAIETDAWKLWKDEAAKKLAAASVVK